MTRSILKSFHDQLTQVALVALAELYCFNSTLSRMLDQASNCVTECGLEGYHLEANPKDHYCSPELSLDT